EDRVLLGRDRARWRGVTQSRNAQVGQRVLRIRNRMYSDRTVGRPDGEQRGGRVERQRESDRYGIERDGGGRVVCEIPEFGRDAPAAREEKMTLGAEHARPCRRALGCDLPYSVRCALAA